MNSLSVAGIFSGSVWQIIANSSTFSVIILLVLCFMSFVSWVIIFNKWRQFALVERDNRTFAHTFRRSRKISEAVGQAKSSTSSTLASLYLAGHDELLELWQKRNPGGGLQENQRALPAGDFEIVEMTMEKTLSEEIGRLERKVVFLASTANSAPFLGLLGTVVGIMSSFWSIGERGSASLAIVAPGIAEALLATIVGLGAAIPAVIAFNWAGNKLRFISEAGNSFILEFIARAKKEVG